jgi:hypothetical protein
MGTLLTAMLAGIAFLVAYHTYGRWLARRLFRLDPAAAVPSSALWGPSKRQAEQAGQSGISSRTPRVP